MKRIETAQRPTIIIRLFESHTYTTL